MVSTRYTLAAVITLSCSQTLTFCLGTWLEFLRFMCMVFVCAPASRSMVWVHYLISGMFYFRCGSITRGGMPLALSWMLSTMPFSGPTCRREQTPASTGSLLSIIPWISPSSSSQKWLCTCSFVWTGRGGDEGVFGVMVEQGKELEADYRGTTPLWYVWVGL